MAVENRKPLTFAMLCVVAKDQLATMPDGGLEFGEWAERIKTRLVRLRLPYPERPHDLTAAMDAVALAAGRTVAIPAPSSSAPPPDQPPLSHADACAILARISAGSAMKRMPNARPLTLRGAEREKALRLVAQGIVEQVQRCEDAECAVDAEKEPSK